MKLSQPYGAHHAAGAGSGPAGNSAGRRTRLLGSGQSRTGTEPVPDLPECPQVASEPTSRIPSLPLGSVSSGLPFVCEREDRITAQLGEDKFTEQRHPAVFCLDSAPPHVVDDPHSRSVAGLPGLRASPPKSKFLSLTHSKKAVLHHDLDHLFGCWSKEEYEEFNEALREQRQIEPEMWK
jgi:hypothetical protein